MQALILAAGRGTRLGPIGATCPKCLVQVAGATLLERSFGALSAAGVDEAILVTGYRADRVGEALAARPPAIPVRLVHNPFFAETGSMESLAIAARLMDGPACLVLESDLLYHPGFLAAASAPPAGDRMMAADLSGSGDEVYLCVDAGGSLTFLGKDAPAARRRESVGEFAGITRVTRGLLAAYEKRVEALRQRGETGMHYEEVLFALAQDGWRIEVRTCRGLPWTEIDTVNDLERARTRVAPAIDAEARRTRP